MKLKKLLTLVSTVAIIIGLTACYSQDVSKLTATKKQKSGADQNKKSVSTAKDGSEAAEKKSGSESTDTVDAFGVIKIKDIHNISIDFPAFIESINVKEGQEVKKGDTLVVLNMGDYETQMKSKEFELSIVKQDLSFKKGNKDPDVAKSLNELQNSEDLLARARKELEAKKELLKTGAISQYDYNEFEKTFNDRLKKVEDAKMSIESSKYNKRQEIDQKTIRMNTLEYDLKLMKEKLSKPYLRKNEIISEFERGLVYDISYVAGDLIDSKKKVLGIMNKDSMVVEVNIAEEFIKGVKIGAEVSFHPLADSSRKYKGKVTRISKVASKNNEETIVVVETSIESPDDFLVPNFNVNVKIYKE